MIGTVIVGGGPAGGALLLAAARLGRLPGLASDGLAVVERDGLLGCGRLGNYAICSDSTAETFLSAIQDSPVPALAALMDDPAARDIAGHIGDIGVPLPKVGRFLAILGAALHGVVAEAGGAVLTGHEAIAAQRTAAGHWRTRLRQRDGSGERVLTSRALVLATGGHQPVARLAGERVAGVPLVARHAAKLVQSDDVLAVGGLEPIAARLAGRPNPRIVVIGGSTSAVTASNRLLNGTPSLGLGEGGLTLLHRRPLRPFYPSAQAALAEGFDDFGPHDICPVSGFVYRLAGFRLEARELAMRALRLGGRPAEPRLRLHRITGDDDAQAARLLDEADVIVAALGYRPRALPLRDAGGAPLALHAHRPEAPPMVDRHCRILGADGRPLPDLYGIGLAAGFVPWGALGGEPSFRGQANGLWLWQNDVAGLILDQLAGGRADLAERAA